MMTDEELTRLVTQEIQFRDWKFALGQTGGSVYLRACFNEHDTVTRLQGIQYGRKWLLSTHMTRSEVVQTALKAVLTALEHEAREDFKYKGATVFGPHHDVEELHRLATHTEPDVRGAIEQWDQTLITEGEALAYAEAVDAFVDAAAYLYAMQQQAEPLQCQILRNVKPDPQLKQMIEKYTY